MPVPAWLAICRILRYILLMPTKTSPKPERRRTVAVPVTTMEEIPVLDDTEHADLLAALREAEAEITAGHCVEYDAKTLKDRLVQIYRDKKRSV